VISSCAFTYHSSLFNFHSHGYGFTTAQAQCCQAALRAALSQRVNERG
jgi:hypothetical protein